MHIVISECVFSLSFSHFPVGCSSCEVCGEATSSVEVCMDGKEHWAGAGSTDTGSRHRAAESLFLLAKKRCVGRAQGYSREQALGLPEEDDHSSQSGHWYHQSLAAEWRQFVLNSTLLYVLICVYLVIFWVLDRISFQFCASCCKLCCLSAQHKGPFITN